MVLDSPRKFQTVTFNVHIWSVSVKLVIISNIRWSFIALFNQFWYSYGSLIGEGDASHLNLKVLLRSPEEDPASAFRFTQWVYYSS